METTLKKVICDTIIPILICHHLLQTSRFDLPELYPAATVSMHAQILGGTVNAWDIAGLQSPIPWTMEGNVKLKPTPVAVPMTII